MNRVRQCWETFLRRSEAFTPTDLAVFAKDFEVRKRIVRAPRDAHARLLAGTDAPVACLVPGVSLHDELHLLVEAGLTPYEALQAATSAPAEFMTISGTIDPDRRSGTNG